MPALALVGLVVATMLGWTVSFASRQARTTRMVLVASALTAIAWLGALLAPRPLDAAVVPLVTVLWYLALDKGSRLGLFALTPDEDRLNDALREMSSRLELNGPEDGRVRRPERLPDELAALDALSPPDEDWARVVRLTREYLLALPARGTARRGDISGWQVIWWDVHDRRILFAPRLEPEFHFEADLRLDRADFLRALASQGLASAERALEHVTQCRTTARRWIEAQDALVADLRARLDAVRSGRGAEEDLGVVAADERLR